MYQTNNRAIDPHLRSLSQEYRLLLTLQYLFPGEYDDLIKSEAPDFKRGDQFGIEVTQAVSQTEAIIDSESVNYYENSSEHKQEKTIIKLLKCGGKFTGNSVLYPIQTMEGDIAAITEVVQKKLKKLHEYRKVVSKVGLAIILDRPLTSEYLEQWGSWIRNIEETSNESDFFDEYYLLGWKQISRYYKETRECRTYPIEDEIDVKIRKDARNKAECSE